jgi:hypothetical protein
MSEKLQKILDFFKENQIELPIDVNNALEDVFNENEEVDNVDMYFREDAEVFEEDIILANNVNADLKGPSSGSMNNVFTYYGEIDYSMSEFIRLVDGEELIEEITMIDQLEVPSRLNRDMYAIVLIENVQWEKGEVKREPHLYVYCPEKVEGEE